MALTMVSRVFRYASAVGDVNQTAKRAGTATSHPDFVLRVCSRILSGEGNMGSVLEDVVLGG
jgi:hypothetical protein